MIKRIADKADKLRSMYVTESLFNVPDEYANNKYFIKFHSTHKFVAGAKTQRELEEKIDEILKYGVSDGSHIFF